MDARPLCRWSLWRLVSSALDKTWLRASGTRMFLVDTGCLWAVVSEPCVVAVMRPCLLHSTSCGLHGWNGTFSLTGELAHIEV
jgi:hypothetical protein